MNNLEKWQSYLSKLEKDDPEFYDIVVEFATCGCGLCLSHFEKCRKLEQYENNKSE